jgi:NhaP-type Na+/H+ or K+/H+ antiporter
LRLAHALEPEQGVFIDTTITWYLLIGALLISMGLMESVLRRWPVSPAMFYLPIGYAIGPAGFGLLTLDASRHAVFLTTITEVALLISLFTVGLKLRVPLSDRLWLLPLRLGILAMLITIGLVALAAHVLLHLPLGPALLLAAILAPTDPILASDVQVHDVGDRDRIRFGLSGEGGMNDGTTYPFVMLGLALCGVQEAADYASIKGLFIALWGFAAGLAVGGLAGWITARSVVELRRRRRFAVGMEEFLTLGLIAVSYGLAHLAHGIGFVAVFAAGVAVRRLESKHSGSRKPQEVLGAIQVGEQEQVAVDPNKASAYMTEVVLGFNQQLEHLAEFAMVLILGVLLSGSGLSLDGALIAALIFIVVRPLSVLLALPGMSCTRLQTGLMAWFGIRGIGSLYYLLYARQFAWLPELSGRFTSIVLTVISMSIVIHGISSTPLMELYAKRSRSRRAARIK